MIQNQNKSLSDLGDPMQDSDGELTSIKPGDIIQGRFAVGSLIGEGSFGQVFKCMDRKNGDQMFAIKVEDESDESSILEREIKVLIELRKKPGFPQIKFYGQEKGFTYCIMSLLGKNLENIARKLNGTLAIATVLRIGIQMIDRIEALHNCRFLHRDIKPDNFVLEAGTNPKQIYLIDFGLAKHYINSKGDHIHQLKKAGLIGTARYASVAAHEEMEQGRKDDLESIGYILIYLAAGNLPWMNLQIESKDIKYAKIHQLKKTVKGEVLCAKLPKGFLKFMQDVKAMEFKEQPNYAKLRKYFQDEIDILVKTASAPFSYDWERLPEYQKKKHMTVHIMQGANQEKLETINEANQKQESTPKLQPQTFDQIMEDKKKGTKKTLHTGKSRTKKQPIMINVQEPNSPDEDKSSPQFLLTPNASNRQQQHSNTYLQLPLQLSSMNQICSYNPSLATSKINNYEWSEKVESEGGGLPIWELGNGNTPGFQTSAILRGMKKPSIFIQRKERKAHTQIDTIKTMSRTLVQPNCNLVKGDDEYNMEGLE